MPKLRKQDSLDGQGSVVVAEFTSGQLVIMICLSLFIAAAVFAVGILVARVENTRTAQTTPTAAAPAPQAAHPTAAPSTQTTPPPPITGQQQTYTIPAMDAGATTPAAPSTQVSPRTDVGAPVAIVAAPPVAAQAVQAPPMAAPTTPSAATGEPAPPAAPDAPSTAENPAPPIPPAQRILPAPVAKPKSKPVPAEPANRDTLLAAGRAPRVSQLPPLATARPALPETAIRVPKPAAPEGQIAPVAPTALTPVDPPAETAPGATANTPITEAGPAVAPANIASSKAAEAPAQPNPTPATSTPPPGSAPEKTVAPAKTAPENASKSSGAFAVQLASFSGPQRGAKAENFQKRVKNELNLNTTIVKSDDDSYYRVVMTGYKDRNAASAACADLRKKTGLSEAFVRPL